MKHGGSRGRLALTGGILALLVCAAAVAGVYFLARNQDRPSGDQQESNLVRLLASVPDEPYCRQGPIYFGDRHQLATVHALPPLASMGDLANLPTEQLNRWLNALGSVWSSRFSGFPSTTTDWRDTFGYDWFQIDREITVGEMPKAFSVMEGALDRQVIQAALARLGYEQAQYEGISYYRIHQDYGTDLDEPVGRLAVSHLNRVVVGDGILIAAPADDVLKPVLDARAGRREALADDPEYLALARAMGPALSAVLYAGEQFYEWPVTSTKAPAELLLDIQAGYEDDPLHRYSLVGLGFVDDGQQQSLVVALVYDDPQEAKADGPTLAARLGRVPNLQARDETLSDYWVVGGPQLHSFKEGSVLTVQLALKDEAPQALWAWMLSQHNLYFLVVGEQ